MITGLFFVFIMTICSVFNMNINNRNFYFRNLHLFLVSLITGFFIFIRTFDFELINFNKFSFFKDPWFIFYIVVTFLTQQVSSKFVKSNENNLIYVQFSNFIFIALVPIISYIFITYFDFKNSININYSSFSEVFIFSFCLIFSSLIIFIKKIKHNILKRADLMCSFILLSSFSFVLNTKLMQVYDSEAFYLTSMLIFSFNWLLLSLKKKEYNIIQKNDYRFIFLAAFIYIVYSYVNILVVKILPSEYIAIFRAITGIVVFGLFDFYKNKKNNISKLDFLAIIIIFFIIYCFNFKF